MPHQIALNLMQPSGNDVLKAAKKQAVKIRNTRDAASKEAEIGILFSMCLTALRISWADRNHTAI